MSDFFELLDQLPDEVRDTMDEMMEAGRCGPGVARLFAKLHRAPEHVVLALFGYLPSKQGDYVHAYATKEKLHIRDAAHFAAWRIHRLAMEPSAEIVRDDR